MHVLTSLVGKYAAVISSPAPLLLSGLLATATFARYFEKYSVIINLAAEPGRRAGGMMGGGDR